MVSGWSPIRTLVSPEYQKYFDLEEDPGSVMIEAYFDRVADQIEQNFLPIPSVLALFAGLADRSLTPLVLRLYKTGGKLTVRSTYRPDPTSSRLESYQISLQVRPNLVCKRRKIQSCIVGTEVSFPLESGLDVREVGRQLTEHFPFPIFFNGEKLVGKRSADRQGTVSIVTDRTLTLKIDQGLPWLHLLDAIFTPPSRSVKRKVKSGQLDLPGRFPDFTFPATRLVSYVLTEEIDPENLGWMADVSRAGNRIVYNLVFAAFDLDWPGPSGETSLSQLDNRDVLYLLLPYTGLIDLFSLSSILVRTSDLVRTVTVHATPVFPSFQGGSDNPARTEEKPHPIDLMYQIWLSEPGTAGTDVAYLS